MPRIRTVKPEFWNDQKIARLSYQARLMFIGSWNLADDVGVLIWHPLYIQSELFKYDQIPLKTIKKWMREITDMGMIYPFDAKAERWGLIVNFKKHQRVNNPSKARNPYPNPEELQAFIGDSHSTNVGLSEDSHRTNPRNREQGTGKGTGKGTGNRDSLVRQKKKSEPEVLDPRVCKVIDCLNARAGKAFKPGTYHKQILTALETWGFEVAELERVIEAKASDPYFQENPKFLRPQTLFGSRQKIEGYLNEGCAMSKGDQIRAKNMKNFSTLMGVQGGRS